MTFYRLGKNEDKYIVLENDEIPIRTPSGLEYSSSNYDLATLVLHDIRKFGTDPTNQSSFVSLHASYLDFGSAIPIDELARSIFMGYTPQLDMALNYPDSPEVTMDMIAFFGPYEDPEIVKKWLIELNIRQLISMQVCGSSFQSILIGFRLLNQWNPFPADHLAKGIVKYSDSLPNSLCSTTNSILTERYVAEFLNKLKLYASFPDETDMTVKSNCSRITCFHLGEMCPKLEQAWTYFQNQEYNKAAHLYKEILETCDDMAKAWTNLGLCLERMGGDLEVLNCYNRAIQCDLNYKHAWNNKGSYLARRGDLLQALDCFKRACDIDKYYLQAIKNCGTALLSLNRKEDAINVFKKALEIAPGDSFIHEKLRQCSLG